MLSEHYAHLMLLAAEVSIMLTCTFEVSIMLSEHNARIEHYARKLSIMLESSINSAPRVLVRPLTTTPGDWLALRLYRTQENRSADGVREMTLRHVVCRSRETCQCNWSQGAKGSAGASDKASAG